MEVDYIYGKRTSQVTGISKYQYEIHQRLPDVNLHRIGYQPLDYEIKGFNAGNAARLYTAYPLQVLRKVTAKRVKHITSQSLAYLLNFLPSDRTLVTCYDLIPWVYDHNRTLPWKLNIKGLRRAQKIITISEYSRQDIIRHVHYPPENIEVIYPAIDHQHYYPGDYDLRKDLQLADEIPIILYVGSEEPRQNLDLLIRCLAHWKKNHHPFKLVKVGEAQHNVNEARIQDLIKKLKLSKEVLFMGNVSEENLPNIYRGADVLVYPCLYAGFGLPPLEAMACGTPVITSNTSSLPEVVGGAGVMVDPHDPEDLSLQLRKVLAEDDLQKNMIRQGLKRAALFSWDKSAQKTRKIYQALAHAK